MAFPAVKFQLFGNRSSATADNSNITRVLEKNSNSKAIEHHNDNPVKDQVNSKLESKDPNTLQSINTKLAINNKDYNDTKSIGHDKSFTYQSSTDGLTHQQNNGLDTSIRSIESKHKEYTIYDRISGLNNPLLNDAAMYEGKIREFAELLEKHLTMKTLYLITIGQLLQYLIREPEKDEEVFKAIQEIINSPTVLKENHIQDLKMLHNKTNIGIKRILIAYVIYQYMSYNALLTVRYVSQKDKNTITKLHWKKGAFKYRVNIEHIIKQTFAEFIKEDRNKTYELIKYQSYQSRMGESSYNNLKNLRKQNRFKSVTLYIKTPAEFLNMNQYQYNNYRTNDFNPKYQTTNPKRTNADSTPKRTNIATTTQDQTIQAIKSKWQKRIDTSNKNSTKQPQSKQPQNNHNPTTNDKITNVNTLRDWSEITDPEPAPINNLSQSDNHIKHQHKSTSRSNNTSERHPLREIKEPYQPKKYSNNINNKIQTQEINHQDDQDKRLLQRLYKKYTIREQNTQAFITISTAHTLNWTKLIRHYRFTLVPTYMESIITHRNLADKKLYQMYTELINHIAEQMVHALYILHCRYNSKSAQDEINEHIKDMIQLTGLKQNQVDDILDSSYRFYMNHNSYDPTHTFHYKLYMLPLNKAEKEKIKNQVKYSISKKYLTYQENNDYKQSQRTKSKYKQTPIEQLAENYKDSNETTKRKDYENKRLNLNDDEIEPLSGGDGIWYMDNKRDQHRNSPKSNSNDEIPLCAKFEQLQVDTTFHEQKDENESPKIWPKLQRLQRAKHKIEQDYKKDKFGIFEHIGEATWQDDSTSDDDDEYNMYNAKYSSFVNSKQNPKYKQKHQPTTTNLTTHQDEEKEQDYTISTDPTNSKHRICLLSLQNNQYGPQSLSMDELLKFEARKLDLRTALEKFRITLHADARSVDEVADEALSFIYECWKWYKLEIEPYGYISEEVAINIITRNFKDQAKERWDEYNLRNNQRITSLYELTRWVQQTFMHAGSLAKLRKNVMDTQFQRTKVDQHLPSAFDHFDNLVKVYNSLLYTMDEKTRRQQVIKKGHIFKKVRNYLTKIGIFQKMNSKLTGELAEPESWSQLRQAMELYHKKTAYMRNYMNSRSIQSKDYYTQDPTTTSAAEHVTALQYRPYRKSRSRTRYDNYARPWNRRKSRSKSRSRYSSRSAYSRSRSKSRRFRSRSRGSHRSRSRYSNRSRSQKRVHFTKSTKQYPKKNHNRNHRKRYKNRNKYGKSKTKYPKYNNKDYNYGKRDYNQSHCRKCGDRHGENVECKASLKKQEKYQERRHKRHINALQASPKPTQPNFNPDSPAVSIHSQDSQNRNKQFENAAIQTSPPTSYYVPKKQHAIMTVQLKRATEPNMHIPYSPASTVSLSSDTEDIWSENENWYTNMQAIEKENYQLNKNWMTRLSKFNQSKILQQNIQDITPQHSPLIKRNLNKEFADNVSETDNTYESEGTRLNKKLRQFIAEPIQQQRMERQRWHQLNRPRISLLQHQSNDNAQDKYKLQAFKDQDQPRLAKKRKLNMNINLNAPSKKRRRLNTVTSECVNNPLNWACNVIFKPDGQIKSHLCHHCYHQCLGNNCNYEHVIPYQFGNQLRLAIAKCQPTQNPGPETWTYIDKTWNFQNKILSNQTSTPTLHPKPQNSTRTPKRLSRRVTPEKPTPTHQQPQHQQEGQMEQQSPQPVMDTSSPTTMDSPQSQAEKTKSSEHPCQQAFDQFKLNSKEHWNLVHLTKHQIDHHLPKLIVRAFKTILFTVLANKSKDETPDDIIEKTDEKIDRIQYTLSRIIKRAFSCELAVTPDYKFNSITKDYEYSLKLVIEDIDFLYYISIKTPGDDKEIQVRQVSEMRDINPQVSLFSHITPAYGTVIRQKRGTITYNPADLPDLNLNEEEFKKFAKQLPEAARLSQRSLDLDNEYSQKIEGGIGKYRTPSVLTKVELIIDECEFHKKRRDDPEKESLKEELKNEQILNSPDADEQATRSVSAKGFNLSITNKNNDDARSTISNVSIKSVTEQLEIIKSKQTQSVTSFVSDSNEENENQDNDEVTVTTTKNQAINQGSHFVTPDKDNENGNQFKFNSDLVTMDLNNQMDEAQELNQDLKNLQMASDAGLTNKDEKLKSELKKKDENLVETKDVQQDQKQHECDIEMKPATNKTEQKTNLATKPKAVSNHGANKQQTRSQSINTTVQQRAQQKITLSNGSRSHTRNISPAPITGRKLKMPSILNIQQASSPTRDIQSIQSSLPPTSETTTTITTTPSSVAPTRHFNSPVTPTISISTVNTSRLPTMSPALNSLTTTLSYPDSASSIAPTRALPPANWDKNAVTQQSPQGLPPPPQATLVATVETQKEADNSKNSQNSTKISPPATTATVESEQKMNQNNGKKENVKDENGTTKKKLKKRSKEQIKAARARKQEKIEQEKIKQETHKQENNKTAETKKSRSRSRSSTKGKGKKDGKVNLAGKAKDTPTGESKANKNDASKKSTTKHRRKKDMQLTDEEKRRYDEIEKMNDTPDKADVSRLRGSDNANALKVENPLIFRSGAEKDESSEDEDEDMPISALQKSVQALTKDDKEKSRDDEKSSIDTANTNSTSVAANVTQTSDQKTILKHQPIISKNGVALPTHLVKYKNGLLAAIKKRYHDEYQNEDFNIETLALTEDEDLLRANITDAVYDIIAKEITERVNHYRRRYHRYKTKSSSAPQAPSTQQDSKQSDQPLVRIPFKNNQQILKTKQDKSSAFQKQLKEICDPLQIYVQKNFNKLSQIELITKTVANDITNLNNTQVVKDAAFRRMENIIAAKRNQLQKDTNDAKNIFKEWENIKNSQREPHSRKILAKLNKAVDNYTKNKKLRSIMLEKVPKKAQEILDKITADAARRRQHSLHQQRLKAQANLQRVQAKPQKLNKSNSNSGKRKNQSDKPKDVQSKNLVDSMEEKDYVTIDLYSPHSNKDVRNRGKNKVRVTERIDYGINDGKDIKDDKNRGDRQRSSSRMSHDSHHSHGHHHGTDHGSSRHRSPNKWDYRRINGKGETLLDPVKIIEIGMLAATKEQILRMDPVQLFSKDHFIKHNKQCEKEKPLDNGSSYPFLRIGRVDMSHKTFEPRCTQKGKDLLYDEHGTNRSHAYKQIFVNNTRQDITIDHEDILLLSEGVFDEAFKLFRQVNDGIQSFEVFFDNLPGEYNGVAPKWQHITSHQRCKDAFIKRKQKKEFPYLNVIDNKTKYNKESVLLIDPTTVQAFQQLWKTNVYNTYAHRVKSQYLDEYYQKGHGPERKLSDLNIELNKRFTQLMEAEGLTQYFNGEKFIILHDMLCQVLHEIAILNNEYKATQQLKERNNLNFGVINLVHTDNDEKDKSPDWTNNTAQLTGSKRPTLDQVDLTESSHEQEQDQAQEEPPKKKQKLNKDQRNKFNAIQNLASKPENQSNIAVDDDISILNKPSSEFKEISIITNSIKQEDILFEQQTEELSKLQRQDSDSYKAALTLGNSTNSLITSNILHKNKDSKGGNRSNDNSNNNDYVAPEISAYNTLEKRTRMNQQVLSKNQDLKDLIPYHGSISRTITYDTLTDGKIKEVTDEMSTPTIPLGAAFVKQKNKGNQKSNSFSDSKIYSTQILQPLTTSKAHHLARSSSEYVFQTEIAAASPGRKRRLKASRNTISAAINDLTRYSKIENKDNKKQSHRIEMDMIKDQKDFKDLQLDIKFDELNDNFIGLNEPVLFYQNKAHAINEMTHARVKYQESLLKAKKTLEHVCIQCLNVFVIFVLTNLLTITSANSNFTNSQNIVTSLSSSSTTLVSTTQDRISQETRSIGEELLSCTSDYSLNKDNVIHELKDLSIETSKEVNIERILIFILFVFICVYFVRILIVKFCNFDIMSSVYSFLLFFTLKVKHQFKTACQYLRSPKRTHNYNCLTQFVNQLYQDSDIGNLQPPRRSTLANVVLPQFSNRNLSRDIITSLPTRRSRSKFLGYLPKSKNFKALPSITKITPQGILNRMSATQQPPVVTQLECPITNNEQGDKNAKRKVNQVNQIEINNNIIGNTSTTNYTFSRPQPTNKVLSKKCRNPYKHKKRFYNSNHLQAAINSTTQASSHVTHEPTTKATIKPHISLLIPKDPSNTKPYITSQSPASEIQQDDFQQRMQPALKEGDSRFNPKENYEFCDITDRTTNITRPKPRFPRNRINRNNYKKNKDSKKKYRKYTAEELHAANHYYYFMHIAKKRHISPLQLKRRLRAKGLFIRHKTYPHQNWDLIPFRHKISPINKERSRSRERQSKHPKRFNRFTLQEQRAAGDYYRFIKLAYQRHISLEDLRDELATKGLKFSHQLGMNPMKTLYERSQSPQDSIEPESSPTTSPDITHSKQSIKSKDKSEQDYKFGDEIITGPPDELKCDGHEHIITNLQLLEYNIRIGRITTTQAKLTFQEALLQEKIREWKLQELQGEAPALARLALCDPVIAHAFKQMLQIPTKDIKQYFNKIKHQVSSKEKYQISQLLRFAQRKAEQQKVPIFIDIMYWQQSQDTKIRTKKHIHETLTNFADIEEEEDNISDNEDSDHSNHTEIPESNIYQDYDLYLHTDDIWTLTNKEFKRIIIDTEYPAVQIHKLPEIQDDYVEQDLQQVTFDQLLQLQAKLHGFMIKIKKVIKETADKSTRYSMEDSDITQKLKIIEERKPNLTLDDDEITREFQWIMNEQDYYKYQTTGITPQELKLSSYKIKLLDIVASIRRLTAKINRKLKSTTPDPQDPVTIHSTTSEKNAVSAEQDNQQNKENISFQQNKPHILSLVLKPHVLMQHFNQGSQRAQVWNIHETVKIEKKYYRVRIMGDTGASISAIDHAYAYKKYGTAIQKLKTAMQATTAGKDISITEYIEITFIDPQTKKPIAIEDFYLIKNLPAPWLASLTLIRKLGWKMTKTRPPPYQHRPRTDETFGECNNWDNSKPKVKPFIDIITTTPYQEHVTACTIPTQNEYQPQAITRVKPHKDLPMNIQCQPQRIMQISNFRATEKELSQAKKLTKAKQFDPVNLEHIKKISMELYERMKTLCTVKYKDVWAKHQFHMKTIPNKEFKIDLKDSAVGTKIYKQQYHLNDEKRLVLTYHAMNNVKNGLYKPNEHSIHNVPIIVIKRKDGRMRLAYDLTKLNKFTKDIQSHLPSYNYLFEKMRGKGYNTVTDLKNFFENIKLREKDQDLVTVTTPLGRFKLTHATYGFKNIATIAQEISEEMIAPIPQACAFIDDIFIKHQDQATNEELYRKAELLLKRAKEMGVLLHPEKTFFFVEEVEFLGYVFSKDGHKPRQEYIDKVLKIPKPKTVKQIQAYLGLIQYIARYVHKLAEWSRFLTILTKKDSKEKWGEAQDIAFNEIQQRIKHVKLLYHPTVQDPFLVQTDASKYAIAGVLYQKQWTKNGTRQWRIIEFYSKQIDPHLIKHPIMVKECLAIAYALNHWKHFLLRQKFFLDTDHKNLISLYDDDETKAPEMRKKPIFHTLRDATALFHFEIAHLAGKDIVLADYLSRDGVVNATHKNVKLLKPKIQEKDQRCLFIQAIEKHKNRRHQIFKQSQDAKELSIPSYSLLKKMQNKIFTIQTLNLEYKKHYGYDCSNKSYSKDLRCTLQCTKPKKSIIKTAPAIKQAILPMQTPVNANATTVDQSTSTKSNLATAVVNMIKNQAKVDPPTINKATYLYQLYADTLDEVDSEQLKSQTVCAIAKEQRINAPNFEVDDMYRRRGKRIRKKTRPFWQQQSTNPSNPKKPTDPNKELIMDKEYDSDSNEEFIDNEWQQEMNDNYLDKQDQHFTIKQSKHRTIFPYTVTPDLAESLYGRIHLPEDYSDKISLQNVKTHQKLDYIGEHIYMLLNNNTNTKSTEYLQDNYPFILKLVRKGEFQLRNGIIYRIKQDAKKLFIPAKLIHALLEYEHTVNNLQHPGVIQMRRQLSKRFYWYKMDVDIQNYVSQCYICQVGKGGIKHKIGKLAPTPLTHHGHTVHLDFAGPFWKGPSILIMIDESTGFVELAVTEGQKAQHIIFSLIHQWYPRHGMPIKVISDRGSGFISHANRLVAKALGIHNVFTSAYHPQTNAKAERTVQEVKKALRMVNINLENRYTPNKLKPREITQLTKELTLLLPAIQFSINQRIHSITKVSPHMLVFGKNLRSKLDHKLGVELLTKFSKEIDHPSKYELVKQIQYLIKYHEGKQQEAFDDYVVIMQKYHDDDKSCDDFKEGDLVAYYIGDRSAKLKKIRQRFSAPWRVIERLRHNVVKIQRADNPVEKLACHVSMLKKYNKQNFVPLTEFLATQSAKDKIKMKQELERKKKAKKAKKAKEKNAKESDHSDHQVQTDKVVNEFTDDAFDDISSQD